MMRQQGLDPLVRSDAPDAVHRMRIACRRLRSLLATYRSLFDREVTVPLREELKWYAALLGEARDAEVMRDRLAHRIAEQPPELVLGDTVERTVAELTAAYVTAHGRVVKAMRGARYRRLVGTLHALADQRDWKENADAPATELLTDSARREWKRLRRRTRRVDDAETESERDESLHDVRKAAKRLRYAAEMARVVAGDPAAKLAKAAKRLQEVLGDRQDGVVAQETLRGLAVGGDGDSGFRFGWLHAQELERAAAADTAYERAWARVARRRLHR